MPKNSRQCTFEHRIETWPYTKRCRSLATSLVWVGTSDREYRCETHTPEDPLSSGEIEGDIGLERQYRLAEEEERGGLREE